jgi:Zn-finger nucleic acid-binding protein
MGFFDKIFNRDGDFGTLKRYKRDVPNPKNFDDSNDRRYSRTYGKTKAQREHHESLRRKK